MKKLLFILAFILPTLVFGYIYTGTTGDCKWEFDTSIGLLKIFGNGAMCNYNPWSHPWAKYKRYGILVKRLVIKEGVTHIGNHAFENLRDLKSVKIPNSVSSIGEQAFSECTSLTTLTIPSNVSQIGYYAFDCGSGLTSVYYNRIVPGKLLLQYDGKYGASQKQSNPFGYYGAPDCILYVPDGARENFINEGWGEYFPK